MPEIKYYSPSISMLWQSACDLCIYQGHMMRVVDVAMEVGSNTLSSAVVAEHGLALLANLSTSPKTQVLLGRGCGKTGVRGMVALADRNHHPFVACTSTCEGGVL